MILNKSAKLILLPPAFLFVIFYSYSSDLYPRNDSLDILHYSFEITLSDNEDIIHGNSYITFHLLRDSVDQITLDFITKSEGKYGMSIVSTKLFRIMADTLIESGFKQKSGANTIVIRSNNVFRKKEKYRLQVKYKGIPQDGLIISKNKFGERTFFADNWPNRARHWIPVIDHPYEKATVDFHIKAPSHYEVVANGKKNHFQHAAQSKNHKLE